MSEPILSVHNLGKTYWLYPTNAKRVLGCFLPPHRIPGAHPHKALEGLTFDLAPGEALGLIGKNGAGKSTALQLLTGIVKPTVGSFSMRGRVCALLELGSGFNPEFTGRDNIEISGSIYGLSPEQIKAEKEAIIEFSEIGDYIDQPVKFYSSGMFLRLAFAVALAGKPDLLIVDEALAVGDIFFRQKCYKRLYELREQGMAVLLVTHSMPDVTEFCDRGLLLEHGKQVFLGESKTAVEKYYLLTNKPASEPPVSIAPTSVELEQTVDTLPCHNNEPITGIDSDWPTREGTRTFTPEDQQSTNGAYIKHMRITDMSGNACSTFYQGQRMRICVECFTPVDLDSPTVGYHIMNARGVIVHAKSSLLFDEQLLTHVPANSTLWFIIEVDLLLECGEYTVDSIFAHIHKNFVALRHLQPPNIIDTQVKRFSIPVIYGSFSIVLPKEKKPSLISHYGIADLPGEHHVYMKNE